MKKNIKIVVKTRNSILFEMFLNGKTEPANTWKTSYYNNPVLHRIAELIVWNQKKKTFVLSKDGPVDSSGKKYEIKDDVDVGVAHPMEMKKSDIVLWQKYFNKNNLKQPFVQIWEPVADKNAIKEDRYKNYAIPCYRFMNQEKHGIIIKDRVLSSYSNIDFAGCTVKIQAYDEEEDYEERYYKEYTPEETLRIKNFSFGKYTRQVNHIVSYLDRITVQDRIKEDDITIESQLPNFTLAQITEFINIAAENNCTNVTALLLNYKNEHFTDFEPMDDFVLGDLL